MCTVPGVHWLEYLQKFVLIIEKRHKPRDVLVFYVFV